jgi:hypothetical protein
MVRGCRGEGAWGGGAMPSSTPEFPREISRCDVVRMMRSFQCMEALISCLDPAESRFMVGEHGSLVPRMMLLLHTSRLYLQHEGSDGGLSTEGERSSMGEDATTIAKHGC